MWLQAVKSLHLNCAANVKKSQTIFQEVEKTKDGNEIFQEKETKTYKERLNPETNESFSTKQYYWDPEKLKENQES